MTDTDEMRAFALRWAKTGGGNEVASLLLSAADELDILRGSKAQPLDTMAHTLGGTAHSMDHSNIGWWRDTSGHGNKS